MLGKTLIACVAAPAAAFSLLHPPPMASQRVTPMMVAEAPATVRSWYDSGLRLSGSGNVVPTDITPAPSALAPRIDALKAEGLVAMETREYKKKLFTLKREGARTVAQRRLKELTMEGAAAVKEREYKKKLCTLKSEGAAVVAMREERMAALMPARRTGSEVIGTAPAGFEWGGVF